jgi:hypothetical protein
MTLSYQRSSPRILHDAARAPYFVPSAGPTAAYDDFLCPPICAYPLVARWVTWAMPARPFFLLRLDEPKGELVGGDLRAEGGLLAGIGRVAEEIAFGFEDETRIPHLRENDGLVDAM